MARIDAEIGTTESNLWDRVSAKCDRLGEQQRKKIMSEPATTPDMLCCDGKSQASEDSKAG